MLSHEPNQNVFEQQRKSKFIDCFVSCLSTERMWRWTAIDSVYNDGSECTLCVLTLEQCGGHGEQTNGLNRLFAFLLEYANSHVMNI